MDAVWQWGLDLIRSIQMVHGPALDLVFKAITFMGDEEFFMLLLPLILWCVDFSLGVRLGCTFLLSAYGNVVLKDLFGHPRPFDLDPSVQLHEISGYGLPSGHSQSAAVVWGVIATEFRKAWVWGVAVLLMVLIGFSRIYLGVHFPTDVLAGWIVGAVVLLLYVLLRPHVEEWLKRIGLLGQLALAVGGPLVLLILFPTKDAASPAASLMGVGIGSVLTFHFVPFSADGPLGQRVARFLVGAVGLIVIYLGLSALFPSQGEPFYFALRVVRYALVGLWAGLGAPWLFLRLRLASSADTA
ncbi:MAG TPA: phosphatase PAP2 family protein [Chloroflexi bacterium]|nr:phosphatase PAP2 family protein [Chloroflexota bacterium]